MKVIAEVQNLCSTCGKCNDQDAEFCDTCLTYLRTKRQEITGIDLESTIVVPPSQQRENINDSNTGLANRSIKRQKTEKCGFCHMDSVAKCSFNYCCVRGCQKLICTKHMYSDARFGKQPVQCCKECEPRLIAGSWRMTYWLLVLIFMSVVAIVVALEAF